jgi:glycerophosphoryl diester phosphodiesterase family protein
MPPSGAAGGLRPRGIGEILSTAFDIYKEHWQGLITIVAVVVVPLTLIQYFLTDSVFAPDEQGVVFGDNTVTVSGGRSLWMSLLVLGISALIGVLITQVLLGALTRAGAGTVVGQPVSVSESFQFGLERLGPILLVGILVALIVFGGFLLLIIPGIIFAVKLTVAIPALVVENRRGTDAISRSWNLTSGHFWHVLGTIIVAAIIAGIITGILGAIGGSNWFVRAILASIGAIITQPFTALVGIVLYLDLRVRKENLDLATLQNDLRTSAT